LGNDALDGGANSVKGEGGEERRAEEAGVADG